ncbi:unnamed protein product [Mycena citricolor]|uniref:Uncharacterized protein n=1 Tax=Mycena citricolor TaxID=2018698 RepID=A0AAD2HUU7_9AGAR|nr:unnamed protein product [Mycena citricolor]CAK5282674.1 unnamed protein product [Mycena citricolor]
MRHSSHPPIVQPHRKQGGLVGSVSPPRCQTLEYRPLPPRRRSVIRPPIVRETLVPHAPCVQTRRVHGIQLTTQQNTHRVQLPSTDPPLGTERLDDPAHELDQRLRVRETQDVRAEGNFQLRHVCAPQQVEEVCEVAVHGENPELHRQAWDRRRNAAREAHDTELVCEQNERGGGGACRGRGGEGDVAALQVFLDADRVPCFADSCPDQELLVGELAEDDVPEFEG